MRSGRQALVLALIGAAGSLLGGCRHRPAATWLSMPVSNWPAYEYFYLAEKQGLARQLGLDLQTLEFPDPQGIVHAYLRGELPIAQITTVEAVDICSRAPERCPAVVLVLDESRGGDQVAGRPGIGSIAELRGKRVGVTLSTLGPYVLSRALTLHGLSLADVQLRHINLDAMPDALAAGDVDAVAFFPPYCEYAARQGHATTLFTSRQIPGEIFDVLVVEPRLVREQLPGLGLLLKAWQAAHELRRVQPQPSVALMARREGLSPAEFRDAEAGLIYFDLRQQRALLAQGGVLQRNLRAVRQVQEQLKLVRPGSPLPLVSDAPLREALR
jgi:NitT/TauT family transport system substrate-binding protein